MRRSRLALSSSLAAIGLSASIALAQQLSQAPSPSASPSSPDDSVDPSMATRPTRYLLRNGMDYLAYREYARALSFFRAVEARQNDLDEAEIKQLKKGIAKAQQGMREAVNGARVVAQGKGRPSVQPGAFALAKPPQATGPGQAPSDPLQLASAELPAPPPIAPTGTMPALPAPTQAPEALMPMPAPSGRGTPVFGVGATRPSTVAVAPVEPPAASPTLPEPASPAPAPSPAIEAPASPPTPPVDPLALPAQASSPVEPPPTRPSPSPSPLPTEPPPPLVLESPSPPLELPPTSPSPVELPPTSPSPVELPTEPAPTIPAQAEPMPAVALPPQVADASERNDSSTPPLPTPVPEPPPAREAPPARQASPAPEAGPPTPPTSTPPTTAGPSGSAHESILSERLAREVEQIAQRPLTTGDDRQPPTPLADPNDPNSGSSSMAQGSPRLAIERAPSPTEARPLRRIPIPEEFVPLGKREWDPNRKYWAAAGTCHMILYFQDPVLERYGQGVEQSLGPIGRYFSYPLDDPKQSNQRNQILQPIYSAGKFCFQVGTLPYKLIVDPPWEAEYDLGYYRPGDRIPADTIMITPTGVGPPLKGRNY